MKIKYRNVLLIDDDEDDGEIFGAALKQVSGDIVYNVLHHAEEALGHLSSKQLNPEVIFLDLNMPVMNGQQFLLEVKRNKVLQDIPVVIFSTTSQPATIKLTKELGAKDFITKPNNFDDLVDTLTRFFTKSPVE